MSPRIMIIDDSPLLRSQLQGGLEQAGYQVVGTDDCEKGLALQSADPVDLVIVDGGRLSLDGFEYLQQVRRIPRRHRRPALIAMMGPTDGAFIELAESLGVDSIVTKPVSLEMVLEQIVAVRLTDSREAGSTWFVEDVPLDPQDVDFNEQEDPGSGISR